MTTLFEDDIVVRTLLNVLDPSAAQLDACAKKKPIRIRMRSSTADTRPRPAWRPAHIEVLERLSADTISVSWSDSCSGRCAEQTWYMSHAPFATFCALTGRVIHRGDEVFRPRARGVHVRPHQQMILVESVEQRSNRPIAGVVTRHSHTAFLSYP